MVFMGLSVSVIPPWTQDPVVGERGEWWRRHLRISAELKYWEPFLDGNYAELMPDGRKRWDHLQDGDADDTRPDPDWERGLETWGGELFGDDESL